MTHVDIVFDGPPSAESGRFIEVEDAEGRSINFGEWVDRADGTWALRLALRPAPVAPPTEEWEDPHPYDFGKGHGRGAVAQPYESGPVGTLAPRTREQYKADQQPVVPVDALGFPTQVGATFTAELVSGAGRVELESRGPGLFYLRGITHFIHAADLDHTSIEDVRPADGRNGQ